MFGLVPESKERIRDAAAFFFPRKMNKQENNRVFVVRKRSNKSTRFKTISSS